MPSVEHEAFVTSLQTGNGVLTPTVFASDAELQEIRRAEASESIAAVDGVSIETVKVGDLDCLRVAAAGAARLPLMLYFHGGGYIWLTPGSCVGALAALAQASKAECLAPHYRRAPEHPFPAAVDDAVAFYRAVLESGRAPGEIVVAGDSAGGGLAIAMLLAAAKQGLKMPAAGFVFSPWTDLAVTGASADSVDDPIVNGAGLRMMASVYLGGASAEDPLASPLYASDHALGSLPPLLVQVGTREALLDDSRRFAAKARSAGADVRLIEHEGVVHMWIVMAPFLPESQAAFRHAADFVRAVAG
jgi:acetyl esterase/lipase